MIHEHTEQTAFAGKKYFKHFNTVYLTPSSDMSTQYTPHYKVSNPFSPGRRDCWFHPSSDDRVTAAWGATPLAHKKPWKSKEEESCHDEADKLQHVGCKGTERSAGHERFGSHRIFQLPLKKLTSYTAWIKGADVVTGTLVGFLLLHWEPQIMTSHN